MKKTVYLILMIPVAWFLVALLNHKDKATASASVGGSVGADATASATAREGKKDIYYWWQRISNFKL